MNFSKKTALFLFLAVSLVMFQLTAGGALAQSSYFTSKGCSGCHAAPVVASCNGCHAHGTHPTSAKNTLNIAGTTNKVSYAPGETVTVTITGGYRTGWVRAVLFDQNTVELARSTGTASGQGSSTTLPATLTAPAPTTPGTYAWKVAWYGNVNDAGGAAFGTTWTLDATNPDHGYQIASMTAFTVTAPADTTGPSISSFSVPSYSNYQTIPIKSFSATDNVGVAGYCLTETNNAASCTSWPASAPGSYTFAGYGAHTLYAFAKDAAGNTSASANATVTIGPKADFNVDGKPDILWRNSVTGDLTAWYMNGVNMTSVASLIPSKPGDPNWSLVDTGDFNNGGKTDILWQNSVTGDLVVWYMNGVNLTGTATTSPANAGAGNTAIKAIAVGNFGGPSGNDILWQDSVTGSLTVWYMNGLNMTNTASLSPSKPGDLNWKFVGLGDFNNDGSNDILWQNSVTGDLAVWYMNGVIMTGVATLIPQNAGAGNSNWKAVAVGDYNNDGKPDILWQNSVTGDTNVWMMNGINMTNSVALSPINAQTPNWMIKK